MGREVSVSAQAIKEIANEKARIFRKKTCYTASLLERAALAWKKKKEEEERQKQKEALKKEGFEGPSVEGPSVEGLSVEGPSFGEAVAKAVVDYDKRKLSADSAKATDGFGWAQYKPREKEGEKKKKKEIPLNTATVVAIRKKIIAQEWARILGTKRKNPRRNELEQEAVRWEKKKEEEKRRVEELRARIERLKEGLKETLIEFGKKLQEQKDAAGETDPKTLSTLLEQALEGAGEVFDIEWDQNSCLIWIEPWEEKRRRKISGIEVPLIYRANIDEDLEISDYEKVEDEEAIESLRDEVMTKPLRESLEGVSFNIDSEEEAQEFLEDKVSDIGRLINLERTESGWLAVIEPWEEMRTRNIKRRGAPPIVTEEIEINWRDGKLEFATEEEEEEEEDSGKELVEVGENKTGGKEDERS